MVPVGLAVMTVLGLMVSTPGRISLPAEQLYVSLGLSSVVPQLLRSEQLLRCSPATQEDQEVQSQFSKQAGEV
jgi:hypothetical protein